MEEEHRVRIEAVRRFLAGERATLNIYRSLNQNRRWFYFWLDRYDPYDGEIIKVYKYKVDKR